MKTEDKISSYLNEQEVMIGGIEQLKYLEDDELLEKMYDFITTLDPNNLSDLQAEELVGIIDDISVQDDEEDIDEIKRVRISPAAKRERKKQYKKNRQKIKIKAKRYRKTASYKRYKRKTKRMSRSGKTSTGKLVRKFI